MTYYVHFGNSYNFHVPLEEMLKVEADNPQAAVEQVIRDGKLPTDRRLRCVVVTPVIQGRKARGTEFWIDFDGKPKHINIGFWE